MPDTDVDRAYMLAILDEFDPQPGDADLPYPGVLYRVLALITAALREPLPPPDAWEPGGGQPPWPPGQPPPVLPPTVLDPRAASLYAAIAHFAPTPLDRSLYPIQVAKRLQRVAEVELMRWTSAPVQYRGPSGTAVGAPYPIGTLPLVAVAVTHEEEPHDQTPA